MTHPSQKIPTGLLYGVAYYPEYYPGGDATVRLDEDFDLMVKAGINVIRVGESVWSTWEPRNGEFNLEWLTPALDKAHERGIKVILGTPTYAIPPWLQTAYPEIAVELSSGEPMPWGARQEIDYSHPGFRHHAERVIRAIMERHAQHPAVIGYQVDNEPGFYLIHNHGTFTEFVRRLKKQYSSVDRLNEEWGLTYWSHRIDDWSELWRPDGNTTPQYDLAWRRYQSDVTTEFIAWQAELVREYARADQFVTTCISYPRNAVDDEELGEVLDIVAANPYYGMQDHLDLGKRIDPLTNWTETSVAVGLFRQADRAFSSKQERYLVTETNAQAIGDSHTNYPPYPGQLKQSALAFISRGAAMIEYWHWHTLPYGRETYWGGVLPHSLKPGRVYREVSEIGNTLATLGSRLDGFEPDADIAIIWSVPSRYAMQHLAPLALPDSEPDTQSYERIFDAFHTGIVESGHQARVFHIAQAHALGAAELAKRFPVLVAAGFYITTDDDLALLRDYAAAGGHLILGPRTAYADDESRVRVAVQPAGLNEAAGAWYEEFSNLAGPVSVATADGVAFPIVAGAAGTRWIDGLIADDAQVLATYNHPRFRDYPAITTKATGKGKVTMVGTVPSPELAASVMAWAAPTNAHREVTAEPLPANVTIASGTMPDGSRAYFIFNWGWEPRSIMLATALTDPVTNANLAPQDNLDLTPWDARVLITPAA